MDWHYRTIQIFHQGWPRYLRTYMHPYYLVSSWSFSTYACLVTAVGSHFPEQAWFRRSSYQDKNETEERDEHL